MKKSIAVICLLFLLTGCWDNKELEDTVIVHGVGFEKVEDQIKVSLEITKPTDFANNQEIDSSSQESAENIILEHTVDTFLEGAREVIGSTKRRVDFGHTEAWIMNEEFAKDEFVRALDIIRRERMLRLNSLIFVTHEDPTEVLNTPTLYEHLVSSELASSLEQTKYSVNYSPITLREFYKLLEGPIRTAYLPILDIEMKSNEKITILNGTAVVKNDHMVGQLNQVETAGLNMLLNKIETGGITVDFAKKERASINFSKFKTKTNSKLTGKQLNVIIDIAAEGTLGDNMTESEVNERFFEEVENKVSNKVKKNILATLEKLQELKADITNIGREMYRKDPKVWHEIQSDYDEIFANAKISIEVNTDLIHQGLINESIYRQREPHNNPYLRNDD